MADPVDVAGRMKAIVDRLWTDQGEGGKAVRTTAKELFPDIVTPDDQLEPVIAPLRAELATLRAEREAEKTAAAEAEAKRIEDARQNDFETKFQKTVKNFSLSPAGIDALAARIKETGNYASPDDAAAYVLKDEKPAQSGSAPYLGPQDANFIGAAAEEDLERTKLLFNDPNGAFLDYEFNKFVADPDAYTKQWAPEFFR